MKRPDLAWLLAAVLFSAALLSSACTDLWSRPEPAPRYDNLVVILIDTLRSDHLPGYGYHRNTAPTLTRLQSEGIAVQGYAASSWTKPSVATLLTGFPPQRHQAVGRADALPAEVPYLPELLAEKGFDTAAYVGNRNVGRKFGFDRGFRHFEMTHPTGKIDGPRVTAKSLALAQELRPPFFLYAHYVDPHDPYHPPRLFTDQGLADGPPVEGFVQPRQVRNGRTEMTPEVLRRMIDQYDGEIHQVDEEVRHLLAGLEEQGLLERTLVVVTSDHGEEFLEHGELTHGTGLYQEAIRVPLIFWARDGSLGAEAPAAPEDPAVPEAPAVPEDPVRTFHQLDFLATALDALGLSPELAEDGSGSSLWAPLVRREDLGSDREHWFHLDLDGRGALAWMQWPAKLIHSVDAPHDRLFDLEQDPRELSPTTEHSPLTEAQQAAELPELRRGLINHHNRLESLAAQRESQTLDSETRSSLAALGYLQLDTPQEELEERTLPRRIPRDTGLGP
ncbi:MAG: sulfatase [Acidobacteriota bacterium]|nr:sulfatase [Acidobacteriota bacterium]